MRDYFLTSARLGLGTWTHDDLSLAQGLWADPAVTKYHGLGREAAAAIIAFTIDRLGVRSVVAGHHPDNLASRRFLGHLGFRYSDDEFYKPTQLFEPRYVLTL